MTTRGNLRGLFPSFFGRPLDDGTSKPDIEAKWPVKFLAGRQE